MSEYYSNGRRRFPSAAAMTLAAGSLFIIKNVAILSYLKKRGNSKEEKVPVYVRITCDEQRAELATGQKIVAKLWDPSEERAKGKTDVVNRFKRSA